MNDRELHACLQRCEGCWNADFELFEYGTNKLIGLYDEEALTRLEMFGQTGSGGIYSVWALPDGRRPVVYQCDEGVDSCLVSSTFSDFLVLLAIGYSRFPCEPNATPEIDDDAQLEEDLKNFQHWLSNLLHCSIPKSAGRLAIHHSPDYPDFNSWLDQNWIDGRLARGATQRINVPEDPISNRRSQPQTASGFLGRIGSRFAAVFGHKARSE